MNEELGKLGKRRSDRLKSCFLDHLRTVGNVSEAARLIGVDRKTAYNWRRDDEMFNDQWKQALEEAADLLEAEARRRAVSGFEEPVLHAGRVVCDLDGRPVMRRRYSDGLLRMLLRAHRPAHFGESVMITEHNGPILSLTRDDEAL